MFQKVAKQSFIFGSGVAVGAFCILRTDDMIYTQFRRHVLFPYAMYKMNKDMSILKQEGVGPMEFVS